MENREIKFRAFDKEGMRMVTENEHSEYLWVFQNGKIQILAEVEIAKEQGGETVFINDWQPIDADIMQFTGLTDKNSKEIYEGDIVSAWSEGYNHKGEVRWRFEGQPSIIIYPAFANQGFWKIHGQKNEKGIYVDDGVEVIGNIYENSDLLK